MRIDPEEYVELVLRCVEQVPRGRVTTYGAIAEVVGPPGHAAERPPRRFECQAEAAADVAGRAGEEDERLRHPASVRRAAGSHRECGHDTAKRRRPGTHSINAPGCTRKNVHSRSSVSACIRPNRPSGRERRYALG